MLPYGTVRYPRNFKKKKRYYSDYANSLRYGTVRTLVSIRISQLRTYTHGTYISNKVKNYRVYRYRTYVCRLDLSLCFYIHTYVRTYVRSTYSPWHHHSQRIFYFTFSSISTSHHKLHKAFASFIKTNFIFHTVQHCMN